MIMDKHILRIESLIKQTGLENESGSIIYSGNSTLKKGDYYFLGQNPGGNAQRYEKDTILKQLLHSGEFNEYLEGYWNGGRHQSNILAMFNDLEVDIKNTFSTNLSFIRSVNTTEYSRNLKDDYELFWPIHEYCLSVIKPKTIICNGADARNFFMKQMKIFPSTYEESFLKRLYRGNRMKCIAAKGTLMVNGEELNIRLLSTFHLSKWPYEDYQENILWLRSRIRQDEELGWKL